MHHRFEAEVAGGLGPGVDHDPSREPRLEGPLHYEFEGWLGDDIVTTSGYWLVSGPLADALRGSALTGFALEDAVVTRSPQFDMLPAPRPFPDRWERLVPSGSRAAGDDVVLEDRVDLLLSDRALELLGGFETAESFTTPADERPFEGEVLQRFLAQQRVGGTGGRESNERDEG